MANRLAESGQLLAPEFKGYTFRFEAGSAPDELDYARAVAAHVGTPVAEIAPFLPEMNWFVEQGLVNRDACPFPNVAMTSAIGRALVADGCRVWINGEGGDEWLGGRPFYYSEQLAAGDLAGAARSFQDDRAAFGWRTALWRLYRYGLGPTHRQRCARFAARSWRGVAPISLKARFGSICRSIACWPICGASGTTVRRWPIPTLRGGRCTWN